MPLALGHRFMMAAIVPGGVAVELSLPMRDGLRQQCDAVERDVRALKTVYDEHAGLQDRFLSTGRVTPDLPARLGLTGLAGRASGQAFDLRCDHPCPPSTASQSGRSRNSLETWPPGSRCGSTRSSSRCA